MAIKRIPFTAKALQEAGFIEYEPDKFGHKGQFQEITQKTTKPKRKEKLPKFDLFVKLCEIELRIAPVPEYRFEPKRRWRMDYAWPEQKVFLEVEGGVHTGGRHTSGKGFMLDMEKYNTAAAQGWRMVRCVPKDIESGKALLMVEELLKNNF